MKEARARSREGDKRRGSLAHLWLVGSIALATTSAFAQTQPVRIGVLTDMASVYSDASGQGSVEAAKMAVEDAGPILGQPAEIIFADHQMKADVGASTARRWFEREGVDTIVDVPSSSVAFALRTLSLESRRFYCSPAR
ncbi:ABC transporter substrate-binding protein [Bradyrhizobium vignae]|nr:hypothetical protein EAV90_28215 [Bradyrhizobium vignae]